jgi:hypothetical protein
MELETESSWSECLSDGHMQYLLERVRQSEEREQAAVDAFLSKEKN